METKIFLISVFSGKMKFGSSGEKVNKANKIRTPELKINLQKFLQSFNSKINKQISCFFNIHFYESILSLCII